MRALTVQPDEPKTEGGGRKGEVGAREWRGGVLKFELDGPRRREISGRLNLCEDMWEYQISAGWTQAEGGGVGVPKFEPDGSRRKDISGRLNPMRGYVGVPKFQPDGPRRREEERGYQNLSRTDPGGGRRRECRSEV